MPNRTVIPSAYKGQAACFPYDLVSFSSSRIVPRAAQLDIKLEHQPPSLQNEFYRIGVDIVNKEDNKITDIR